MELGIVSLNWVGSGWVVKRNRQLEMGANVECEELGCVVGGPFKPNKLREVRGLVWRPWINKPSEMTMRCADICHHTAPASKHKLSALSLLLSPCPTWSLSFHPSIPLFIPSILISPILFLFFLLQIFFLTPIRLSPMFHLLLYFCSSSLLLPISIPPFNASPVTPSIHPFIHACMAGRPSGVLCVL